MKRSHQITKSAHGHQQPHHFRKGELAEVCSEVEIRATLDAEGKLEHLPFMPEMLRFCGKRFRVVARLDTVFVEGHGFVGRLERTVLLDEVRCDGSAHGGCQVGCLILWKEAWLKPAQGAPHRPPMMALPLLDSAPATSCDGETFSCQATEVVRAVKRLAPWALWHYARDYAWGERSLVQLLKIVFLGAINKIRRKLGMTVLGVTHGTLTKTPVVSLGLEPGDLVRVKSREEIRAMLDTWGKTRGLAFTHDMLRFCGQTFRVARRVARTVSDFSGEMRQLPNTVALEGVHCSGVPLGGCSRRCYHLWREAWLEKIESPTAGSGPGGGVASDAAAPAVSRVAGETCAPQAVSGGNS